MIKEIKTLYPVKTYVTYKMTEEDYNSVFDDGQYYKFHELHENGSDGFCIAGRTKDRLMAVLISFDFYDNIDLETIVHECYHAAFDIWDFIGAKQDVNNDEPFSYLLSYLFKECNNYLNEIEDENKD